MTSEELELVDGSKLNIDISEKGEKTAFIRSKEINFRKISENNSRRSVLEELEKKGLHIKYVEVTSIFKHEISLSLQENSRIEFDGRKIV